MGRSEQLQQKNVEIEGEGKKKREGIRVDREASMYSLDRRGGKEGENLKKG